jgi:2'-5' RNA ligase
MPRLFTGIELPETVREQLARLRAPLPGARWVEVGNLHLTLRFAGDIDNRVADELVAHLAEIRVGRFEMRLAGVGSFGGNDPKVVWVGVEAGPELAQLAKANERAARLAGLTPEGRAFKPHVTLARLRYGRPDAVARWLQHHAGFRSEPISVDHFQLFSSRPQIGGGPYAVEETFALEGALPPDYLDSSTAW